MYLSFEQLPSDARVWIYQAERPFSAEEEKMISSTLKNFCSQWMVHGHPLPTSFKIEFNQFIILAVDQSSAEASGCSIDGSVRIIKELSERLHIDFFNRLKTACLVDQHIGLFTKEEIISNFILGKIIPSTITFNNLVSTKIEFEKNWKTTIEKSWLAKYLPKDALSI